ncbi:MAG TPA: V-type ATP synthase subunit E family protein [Candidatus Thermoplasmatota archaeon]|nr:V-type ATP synthase subunit E family protein [Candidatus Thermoplasmatota archaeon]
MALEKVVENVLAQGRAAAKKEIDAARAEADAIVQSAEREAAAIRARREAEAKTAAESLRKRDLASAELEGKKVRLNAQKDVLAEARKAVLERLAKLPAERRAQHIQTLLKRAMPNGLVYVAAQDKAAAEKLGVKVAGTIDALGGVVVVSPDGATREDFTYEALLDDVWNASLHEVAGLLFKE